MKDFIYLVKSDLNRYEKATLFSFILFDTNFLTVFLYRISHFFYKKGVPLLPKIIMNLNKVLNSAEINYASIIGEGFRINHSIGIVIGSGVRAGKNLTVNQGVTLGGNFNKIRKLDEKIISQPYLGDNVALSAGCKILGPVYIQNNVIVGANSVVIKDIEENIVVAGIPARKIRVIERNDHERTNQVSS
ncbi:serine acetyltransferase [Ureibacillus terrenus]|uniref:serine O-acetyltransferase n=1 Tax=Ureibacillus terrenus TaxID=118246 RepID=UPI002E21575B|nr:serine acetyltransferase [Ureibacillus terrenus]